MLEDLKQKFTLQFGRKPQWIFSAPGRTELANLRKAILCGDDIRMNEALPKHADWVDELKARHTFTEENTEEILRQEVGAVFAQVLENAGVYARDREGKAAFLQFIQSVNQEERK